MDYLQMTAPCGLDCFNCHFYLAHEDPEAMGVVENLAEQHNMPASAMLCHGCRNHDGQIPLQKKVFGDSHRCAAYECAKGRGVQLCGDCDQFPCNNLHPYADQAGNLPHNIKVYNLCLIKKLGLDEWAESKAAKVRQMYFDKPWTLS